MALSKVPGKLGALMAKAAPHLKFELEAGFPKFIVVGVDEVGRGCLAGSVVAGAVLLPANAAQDLASGTHFLSRVADSKLLAEPVREELAPLIKSYAHSWGIGEARVEEIEKINILRAAHLAMQRAVEALVAQRPELLNLKPKSVLTLIDGNLIPRQWPWDARAIVKGDLQSLSIACASVIAKVHRDSMMKHADSEFPGYGFGVHKGYSTPQHQRALQSLGPCPLHRASFAPVREVQLSLLSR